MSYHRIATIVAAAVLSRRSAAPAGWQRRARTTRVFAWVMTVAFVATAFAGPGAVLGAGAGDDAAMRMLLPVGRSGWAIAAGYLGLFSFLCFPAPFAVLVSLIAIADLKRNPQAHGMGRAVFGLVAGGIGTVILIIALVGGALGR
jgi:hypothetical protein